MTNRKYNIVGGGYKTNENGFRFERDTDFLDLIEQKMGFSSKILNLGKEKSRTAEIYKNNKLIGYHYEKQGLYIRFFEPKGYNYRKQGPSILEPDFVFLNELNKTAYIIEKKFQGGGGSVDEKLQTCDYKRRHYYEPKFKVLGYKTKFYWMLSDYFDDEKKSDVFDYIKSVGCDYFFNFIPFKDLGIE